MSSIISFAGLVPGIYQIATPDEIYSRTETVTLREEEHFWLEVKSQKRGDDWEKVGVALHTSTPGLLRQAEAIGARAVSAVVELDRQRIRVVARGWCLGSDGVLEVVEKSKEYDLAAELMKAALKEVRGRENKPDEKAREQQTTALVKTATEETALALVATLPPAVKARVMEARLEVQTHREALCRTKSENMVLRYFIQKRGGVLRAKPGIGEITVSLIHYMMIRKPSSEQVRQATDSLYGPPTRAPEPVAAAPEEPEVEERGIIDGEIVDASETDVAAEDPPAEMPAPQAAGDQLPLDDQGDQVVCDECGTPLPNNVVAYCQSARGREAFGGANYCFKCQGKHRTTDQKAVTP